MMKRVNNRIDRINLWIEHWFGTEGGPDAVAVFWMSIIVASLISLALIVSSCATPSMDQVVDRMIPSISRVEGAGAIDLEAKDYAVDIEFAVEGVDSGEGKADLIHCTVVSIKLVVYPFPETRVPFPVTMYGAVPHLSHDRCISDGLYPSFGFRAGPPSPRESISGAAGDREPGSGLAEPLN